MAQVLKEELRIRILDSAKNELLSKGVRDASMRNIAFHSGMTVGNLYRYFKSKDELIQMIVSPALIELNQMITKKTQDRLSLFKKTDSLKLSKMEMVMILDSIADDLTLIFNRYHDEMQILFMDSMIQTQLADWFTDLLNVLIHDRFNEYQQYSNEIGIFAKMMSVSIFTGLQEFFRQLDHSPNLSIDVGGMIRLYFRLYLSMLDVDLSKLLMKEY